MEKNKNKMFLTYIINQDNHGVLTFHYPLKCKVPFSIINNGNNGLMFAHGQEVLFCSFSINNRKQKNGVACNFCFVN